MLTDKQIKEQSRPIFWKNPEKYYATEVLKEEGFCRRICTNCKKPFWSTDSNKILCGDPGCNKEISFSFIGKSPAKNQLSYLDIWKEFSKMFKKFGYTPIRRYPVVARWNPTMEYTNASIAAFQPYVISGEIQPPANKLVIPQFCMRFSDIDNVGVTMSHNTGFVMIGQHMFVQPEEWDQNEAFRHIHLWLKEGLGLPNSELTFHEDAWAGGGNFGCCMEFFSRGNELGNQVYMLYEQTQAGKKDLKIKVLDMGMGMERNAWFSQGTLTQYDATFPSVLSKLKSAIGVDLDLKLLKKYVPHAGQLNCDETQNIDKSWENVAKKIGVDVNQLRTEILQLSGVYSIAEHARSLLVVLNDGALPSNSGGGYNLRILARRVFGFIDKYKWDVSLQDIASWHADYLKPIFPELSENLKEISSILDVEKEKYENTKLKSKAIIKRIINEDISDKRLLSLYDNQGIPPELIRDEAERLGKKVYIPDDFYSKVSALHEKKELIHSRAEEIDGFEGVKDTEIGYYDDYKKTEFKSRIVKIVGKYLALDKTYFYPTSGGQINDIGTINGENVVNVFKQGAVIIHELWKEPSLKEGNEITGKINANRRSQLAKHHTGAHILNAAARIVLGNHINQAGAKKTVEKGHLDITHYKNLTQEEVKAIEKEANRIIDAKIKIEKSFMDRREAEDRFGMGIYQGGAVPGKKLRIVNIIGVDVECCGGTHLDTTIEAKPLKIVRSSKISDSVVRLEYKAGEAAVGETSKEQEIIDEAARLLDCKIQQLPGRVEELFDLWKKVTKKKKDVDTLLKSTAVYDGDVLDKISKLLKTQPENIIKTILRFKKDIGG
ncbi:MAG: alanine--tRNA ligase [Nanoarchaeota archaeon]